MGNDHNDDMRRYYALRAREYERIYAKPERQADIAAVKAWLPPLFEGRQVLEVACGTGYWTPFAAATSAAWTATDVNDEVLTLARAKALPHERVQFKKADAYGLGFGRQFDAAFAGFWWSHVPLARLPSWLETLHAKLQRGARVVFIDNRYVEGSSSAVTRTDDDGNRYQQRRLDDGSTHEVLKNFPTREQALAAIGSQARSAQWHQWAHYWSLAYELN